jgi:putative sugar O-methyltransferase
MGDLVPIQTGLKLRNLWLLSERLARRVDLWRIIRRGKRRFSGDLHFRLHWVDEGFAPRPGEAADDVVLLGRICDAWSKAMEAQRSASETFQPHNWWKAIQRTNLEPAMRALSLRDFDSLRRMYRNFFRNPCGAGLTGLPLARIRSGERASRSAKQLCLIDALHRIDLWKRRTGGRFALSNLTPPDIGNPFGVLVDGTFVRHSSEDQHYCAHRIIDLFGPSEAPVVAEIGGGFGGMAYFLIRDRPGVTYLNFDLPETIALASYYLLSAFPNAKATLYGEADLGAEALRNSQFILMPGFAIQQLPKDSVDVAFNARILSDLSAASLREYLAEIKRTTRGYFLHLNRKEGSLAVQAWLAANAPCFKLIEKRVSEWNDARTLRPNEMECLYQRVVTAQEPSAQGHPSC